MNSKEKESDELFYTVRSLVTVRNQLPAQVVKEIFKGTSEFEIFFPPPPLHALERKG